MYKVENLKGKTINVIVSENVMPGSIVFSDEYMGYRILGKSYVTDRVNHSAGEYVRGETHTNTIENAWSLFKRGVIGIYHQVSDKHLQRYLDEFMGRANTRSLDEHERVNLFLRRTVGLRLTYEELIS